MTLHIPTSLRGLGQFWRLCSEANQHRPIEVHLHTTLGIRHRRSTLQRMSVNNLGMSRS
jgi:hypothetical protein